EARVWHSTCSQKNKGEPAAMDHCETTTYHFKDDGTIPNNTLPLVYFRQCLPEGTEAGKKLLADNNWGDTWEGGVYDYHHYHSTAHEFLGVLQGSATLQMGGEEGHILEVSKGDVLIIPAGVGHKCLQSGPAFKVMGAYPDGQTWDLRKGDPDDRPEVLENIKKV